MASSPPPAPPTTKPAPPAGPANSQAGAAAPPEVQRAAVLPLRDVVVFPYVAMPLLVGRQASLNAIEAAAADGGTLFLVAQKSADTEEPAASDLHRVGVVARIVQATRQANGTARILVEGRAPRARDAIHPRGRLPARGVRRRHRRRGRGSRGAPGSVAPRARPVRGVRLAPPAHPERGRRARTERRLDRATGVRDRGAPRRSCRGPPDASRGAERSRAARRPRTSSS